MTEVALSSLSWSAPRLDTGDFTPEDPLAIDHLHQQLSNQLWPAFTTRTGRAFYYVVVCYGLRLVDELLHQHGLAATDDNRRREFERWERLWAMAVCESHDGAIPPVDAMRGRNGAVRAWRSTGEHRPIDYALISRQLELGALGAYRTSLVEHGLLSPDVLRPTPNGAELADRMWADDGSGGDLDAYVRACLEPGKTVAEARVGTTTLRSLGVRCRLSSVRHRPDLQARLGRLLFDDHPPPVSLRVLPEMAGLLVAARRDEVRDPRTFLAGLVEHRWGATSPEVAANARVAVVFGDLASALRAVFDRAYKAVHESGWRAPVGDVATAALGEVDALGHLAGCLAAWREVPEAARRVRAEVHGGAFAGAVEALDLARPIEALDHLLTLHRQVQLARGKSLAWIRRDGDEVLLEAGGYRSWFLDGTSWGIRFKFDAMTELLRDLGRVA